MLQLRSQRKLQGVSRLHRHRTGEDLEALQHTLAEPGEMCPPLCVTVARPTKLLCEPRRLRTPRKGTEVWNNSGQRRWEAVLPVPGIHPDPVERVQHQLSGIIIIQND
jgi:hypothetical protein